MTAFERVRYPVSRVSAVANVRREKVLASNLDGRSVAHYSIPNVQEYGAAVIEDGGTIDSDKWRIRRASVLVSKLNPRKQAVAIAHPHSELTVASTEFVVLEVDDRSSRAFLYYSLTSPAVASYLDTLTTSATRSHQRVQPEDVEHLRIPWPVADIRRQISDYLDHETAEIDAFIADLSQLSQLEIDRVRSDQELAITTAAPVIPIRRLSPVRVSGVSVNASQDPAIEGQVGVLKTSAVSRGYFRPEENKAVVDEHEIARLTAQVMSDRVLVNRANTPLMVGSAAYVENAYADLYLSDKIWSLDFDADNEYVWRALQTRYYRDQVELSAVGASTSMQNLGYEDFLSARLPIPCIAEQRRIAIRLRSTWYALQASLADIDAAIALAKERRAALITAAVTGQIDVTSKQIPAVDSIQSAIEEAR